MWLNLSIIADDNAWRINRKGREGRKGIKLTVVS